MVSPCAGLVGAEGRFPLAQQHHIDDVPPVDGLRDGPAHAHILKEGLLHVEAEKDVGAAEVAVFVEIFPPFRAGGLPQVLEGGQIHEIELPGPCFQKHGGHVRDDAEHHLVDMRASGKVGGRGRQRDARAGLPALESIGPGPHGLAGKGRLPDVLPFQDMLGQDGLHPGEDAAGKELIVQHFKSITVDDFQVLDAQEVVGIGAGRGRIADEFPGEGHVLGREFHTVFPEDALAQGEAVTPALVLHAVALRRPDFRLKVLVHAQGGHIEHVGHLVRSGVRGQVGDEVGGLPDAAEQDAVPVHGGGVRILGGCPLPGGLRLGQNGADASKQQRSAKKTGAKEPCRRPDDPTGENPARACPSVVARFLITIVHNLESFVAFRVWFVLLTQNCRYAPAAAAGWEKYEQIRTSCHHGDVRGLPPRFRPRIYPRHGLPYPFRRRCAKNKYPGGRSLGSAGPHPGRGPAGLYAQPHLYPFRPQHAPPVQLFGRLHGHLSACGGAGPAPAGGAAQGAGQRRGRARSRLGLEGKLPHLLFHGHGAGAGAALSHLPFRAGTRPPAGLLLPGAAEQVRPFQRT